MRVGLWFPLPGELRCAPPLLPLRAAGAAVVVHEVQQRTLLQFVVLGRIRAPLTRTQARAQRALAQTVCEVQGHPSRMHPLHPPVPAEGLHVPLLSLSSSSSSLLSPHREQQDCRQPPPQLVSAADVGLLECSHPYGP